MPLEYVPLLSLQRDLYTLPRGRERFTEYLRQMIDPETGDLGLPLVAMNPMGKDHLLPFLENLLALDADGHGARAAEEAQRRLGAEAGDARACLVVSDDRLGGWTNRYTAELGHRFGERAYYKRGWIQGLLWTSEGYTAEAIREEMLTSLFRAAYIRRHGEAQTLAERMAQEGWAMAQAGCREPALDAEDLAYTREVLEPLRDSREIPVILPALFGDAAARELGYTPLGISPRAGLALALAEERESEGLSSR